jgi:hypothetical protein
MYRLPLRSYKERKILSKNLKMLVLYMTYIEVAAVMARSVKRLATAGVRISVGMLRCLFIVLYRTVMDSV